MADGRTEKITFTCSPSTRAYLKEWAHRNRQSVSSLIEWIVNKAIEENKEEQRSQKSEPSIAELVNQWDLRKLAEQALMPIENLEAIARGERPSDDDLICLGRVLEVDTAELLRIRIRDFPFTGNGERRKHG
jgi:hypothetical protein